jgi:TM2 domain-containing membrane protein YozV/DNA-directed RNA polymerase subunit RPC12/RpoP
MIRFACPGCGATFSVDDAKGGKLGNCPKCQSQFQIPSAGGAAPPAAPDPASVPLPAPPAAGDPAAPVEINPCPKCGARLSVGGSSVGSDVECPYCKEVFRAVKVGGLAPAPSAGGSKSRRRLTDDDEDDRPSRRRRDDEDDRPSRRRPVEDEDDRPSRRRRRRDEDDEEDEEDDRPRRKKRQKYDEESKRIAAGVLALLIGGWGVHKFYLGYTGAGVLQIVISLVTCGFGGIIALVEGIIYLTKTDEEFIETYQIGTKEWF